jgi:exopolysaccharide biosynthesis polyprenyl glycosylphosphotransferase
LKTLHRLRFIFSDLIAASVGWVMFYTLRKYLLGEEPEPVTLDLIGHSVIVGSFWVLFYGFIGFYNQIYAKSRTKEFLKTVSSTFLGSVFIFFALLLDDEGVVTYTAYYKTFLSYFFIQFTFTVIGKLGVISYTRHLLRTQKISFNTLLVGSGNNAEEIIKDINGCVELMGMKFIGYVHVLNDNKESIENKLRHFGSYKNLETIIRRCKIKQVVIAVEPNEHKVISEVLNILEGTNVSLYIMPDIYQLIMGSVRINQIFGIPLININQDLIPVWQKAMKRGIDICVSVMVIFLGMPVFLLIAFITKVTSKGPVFYMQDRIGRKGLPFKIYKFRSMYLNSESNGPALASTGDPRVTSWGKIMRKARLDEFPQFYNVLIGDMSLVGPRPERQFFIDQIIKVAPHYKHLQRVRPGITSLGQVKFGYAENVDQMVNRLKYDIVYIENMSLSLDLWIIMYTMLIMIQGRGK